MTTDEVQRARRMIASFLDKFAPHIAATIHHSSECAACLEIHQAQVRRMHTELREVRGQDDAAAERSAH